MHPVAGDELAEVQAQLVVRAGGNMVEFVHRDQPVVERLHAEPVHREAEGGVGADQHLVIAFKESADRIDLAAVLAGRSEEHTSELQSLMRISYAVFCLKKKKQTQ